MRTDPIPRTMQAVVYRDVNDLRVETVPVGLRVLERPVWIVACTP